MGRTPCSPAAKRATQTVVGHPTGGVANLGAGHSGAKHCERTWSGHVEDRVEAPNDPPSRALLALLCKFPSKRDASDAVLRSAVAARHRNESSGFSTRSHRRIQSNGGFQNPRWLMEASFGDLLRLPGLGVKSLIEICTLIEATIDIADGIAKDLSFPTATDSKRDPDNLKGSVQQLTELMNEPWADQICERDPRFRLLLPPGHGTLEERAEAALADPTSEAARHVHALLGALPAIRAIVSRVESQYIEDSLIDLLDSAIGRSKSRLEAVILRLGARGTAPRTLQDCGDQFQITRERVRQLEDKVRGRLSGYSAFLPKLDTGITILERSAPLSVGTAATLLQQHGISRIPFAPASLNPHGRNARKENHSIDRQHQR